MKHVYGQTSDARIADPADATRVFQWLLERSEDDRGNVVAYGYKSEDLANVPKTVAERHRHGGLGLFANKYLKRIRYANTTAGDAGSYKVEVVLDYGEHDALAPTPTDPGTWPVRLDPFSTYRAGFESRTYRLCRRVLAFHSFPELGASAEVVRSTDFVYDERAHVTRLVSATATGWKKEGASYTRLSLPALLLTYTPDDVKTAVKLLDAASAERIPGGVPGTGRQWVDLEGEGIPGVLTDQGGALYYQRNLGSGRLAPPKCLGARPALAATGGGVQPQLLDPDGDGRLDLVDVRLGHHARRAPAPISAGLGLTAGGATATIGAYGEGDWDPFVAFASRPNVDFSDPNVRFMDLNGDGLPDVLVAGDTSYTWYPSLGRSGWGGPRRFTRRSDDERGPAHVFSDAQGAVFLADMSGDGLSDFVRVENGRVCYWPNLGHGRFGAKVTMKAAPRMEEAGLFDPARVRLADVDGSGTTDLLYVGAGEVRLWRNESGNGFSSVFRVKGVGSGDAATAASVQVVDLLGTGTATIVWSSPLPGAPRPVIRYVELMGGVKPHLLSEVDGQLGLETKIAYAPSTKFYLSDRVAGRPWATRLPFPVQVVERVETYDAVRKARFVSTYAYHHGHWDGAEREFRGFGCVEQSDTESFGKWEGKGLFPNRPAPVNDEYPQPPVLTRTWFHTGVLAGRSGVSKQFEAEYWKGDANQARLPDTLVAEGLGAASLSTREQKEAARALRGSMLRQEVFSQDGTGSAIHPYVVSERTYLIRRVQPEQLLAFPVGAEEARPAEAARAPAVFFAHAREALDSHYERNPLDPRVAHGFVLDVDPYGTVLKTASVAYPRRAPAAGVPEQGRLAVTVTESTVAPHVTADPEAWRLAVPVETNAYELTGLVVTTGGGGAVVPFTWDAVSTAVSTAAVIPYHQAPAGGAPPPLEKRLLARVKALYWDSATLGGTPAPLAFGTTDRMALPYEMYRLAFTPAGLTAAYGAGRVTDAMLTEGGYVHLGDTDWWVPSGRATPVVARFYRPEIVRDAFGTATTLAYDPHNVLVTSVTDALGNVVTASGRDYRLLAPVEMTDPNGNRTAVTVDALGRVTALALMGKTGAGEGDTLADPTVTFEYQVFQWRDLAKPNYVKTRARVLHGPSNPRWLETYAYSDGSGNVVMTKVPAEPTPGPVPRWVGTGRTVLDNKGNVIKQYEPFYSATSAYEDEADLVLSGVTPIFRYDPVGRLLRTEFPDGTLARVTFDPWKQESFDPNDTVLDPDCKWYLTRQPSYVPTPSPEDQRAATLAYAHANTAPESHLDPLGRTVLAIEDNGAAGQYQTRVAYDVEGNAKTVTDARGNTAASTTYGHGGAVLHHVSNDAGERWMLVDVQGAPLRGWDQRGHVVRVSYDALRRPTHVYVSGGALPAEILRQRTLYGELLSDVLTRNLRGRAYQVWDGAGLAVNERFDFKGNPTEARRRLASAYTTEPDWTILASVNDPSLTESTAASLLVSGPSGTFTTTAAFDALSRPTSLTTPDASEHPLCQRA